MVTILMMPAKMAIPGLPKIKVFWNIGYDVIISVHEVTNKTLSRDSNYIIDVVMWPTFGNCRIFMTKVITTSILFYKNLTKKPAFLEGWCWFKFNNFGLALGTKLKFYSSVAKGLTIKIRKILGLNPMFVKVSWGLFAPPSPYVWCIYRYVCIYMYVCVRYWYLHSWNLTF